jgi:lycopene beta-cyclase
VGYEVEVEGQQFIEDQLVLMDFDSNFKEGLAFIYCLPTSNNKALIEYTVFSEELFVAEQLTDRLLEKIDEYTKNAGYKIVRKEAGILPMGLWHLDQAHIAYLLHPFSNCSNSQLPLHYGRQ